MVCQTLQHIYVSKTKNAQQMKKQFNSKVCSCISFNSSLVAEWLAPLTHRRNNSLTGCNEKASEFVHQWGPHLDSLHRPAAQESTTAAALRRMKKFDMSPKILQLASNLHSCSEHLDQLHHRAVQQCTAVDHKCLKSGEACWEDHQYFTSFGDYLPQESCLHPSGPHPQIWNARIPESGTSSHWSP